MSRTPRPYIVHKRKDAKTYALTLNSVCGLPQRICAEWQRKSYQHFPDCLAQYREPKSKAAAETAALALVQYLMTQVEAGTVTVSTNNIKVGPWLEKFITLDDNPRSARIMGGGSMYSVETIDLYAAKYNRYIKNDPFCSLRMAEVEQTDVLGFMGRLGLKEKEKHHGGGPIAGTRTYEIAIRFVRMAFTEYGETHQVWRNPFDHVKAPKTRERIRPGIEEWEIKKLFVPGVIPDPLDRAICAAMFWAGMRRGEIYGLKPEDLDWDTPQITIKKAWQRYGYKKRSLGDPKWHKIRDIAFPQQLQTAIKELWAAYGKHDFVFTNDKGKLPGANYIRRWLPRWMKAAGIKAENRSIVPHSSRHSLASALENDGVSLRQIGDMLGHAALKTTKRYLHDTADHINKMGHTIEEIAKDTPAPAPDTGQGLKIG